MSAWEMGRGGINLTKAALLEQLAEAWDRGFEAGYGEATHVDGPGHNPYR
jgi:hypothetical protein